MTHRRSSHATVRDIDAAHSHSVATGLAPRVKPSSRIRSPTTYSTFGQSPRKRSDQNGERTEQQRWWFASTGIPLLAATLGPLANMLSIAALVTYWRANVFVNGTYVNGPEGKKFPDPIWCYWPNLASLILGFLGNTFLLLNFTQRIRYLIALPVTMGLWYLSAVLLAIITFCMHMYAAPHRPEQDYTQGYWYGIIAAVLYFYCSVILMINLLGHFLRYYPADFVLTDPQRTLILQTMVLFLWLAGGAGIFSRLETKAGESKWDFTDALYFCDVTILTIGFGDFYPTTNTTRGIVLPYSIGGFIILALVISSIFKSMETMGEENIIQRYIDRTRVNILSRTVSNPSDFEERAQAAKSKSAIQNLISSTPIPILGFLRPKPNVTLLKHGKDRFEEMRRIQRSTARLRKWSKLTISVLAFSILWCLGAAVFWNTEKQTQNLTYWQALYFSFIALVTIGYGDIAPKSNAGRCFFLVWSVFAVPTVTTLVGNMSGTVVEWFKDSASSFADFTVLPKKGSWRKFMERKFPRLMGWMYARYPGFMKSKESGSKDSENRSAKKEEERSGKGGDHHRDLENCSPGAESRDTSPTFSALCREAEADANGHPPTPTHISYRLALALQLVTIDMSSETPKRYSYEEWVEFLRLIRLSRRYARKGSRGIQGHLEESEEERIEKWNWIGDDSPLLTFKTESEWLMGRLMQSLVRVEGRRLTREERGEEWEEKWQEECEEASASGVREMEGRTDRRNDLEKDAREIEEDTYVQDPDWG